MKKQSRSDPPSATYEVDAKVFSHNLLSIESCLYKSNNFLQVFRHILFIDDHIITNNGVVQARADSGFLVDKPFYVLGQPLINFVKIFSKGNVVIENGKGITFRYGRSKLTLEKEDIIDDLVFNFIKVNSSNTISFGNIRSELKALISTLGKNPASTEENGVCLVNDGSSGYSLNLSATDRRCAVRFNKDYKIFSENSIADKKVRSDKFVVLPTELCNAVVSNEFDDMLLTFSGNKSLVMVTLKPTNTKFLASYFISEGKLDFNDVFSRKNDFGLFPMPKDFLTKLSLCSTFDNSKLNESEIRNADFRISNKNTLHIARHLVHGNIKHVCRTGDVSDLYKDDLSVSFDYERIHRALKSVDSDIQIGFSNKLFAAESENFEFLLASGS